MIDSEIKRRHDLSEALKTLENNRGAIPALTLIARTKELDALVKSGLRWEDSASSIETTFKNLFQDTDANLPYLAYTDITRRLTNLKVYAASQLTPEQAQAAGVASFQRIGTQAAEQGLETGIRLDRPGGNLFEVGRELPEPLTEEAVRRGAQAKTAGQEVLTELAPIAAQQRDEMEKAGITNAVLAVSVGGLMIFMKNKVLAALLSAGLIYYLKRGAVDRALDAAKWLAP